MAFINNTVTKDDIFIRVGEVYFGTTGTLSADSTNTVTVGSSYFANTEFVDKVIVFSNGKSKYITARTSDTVVSVSPTFSVPSGTTFTVYNSALSINENSVVTFGKVTPNVIMTNQPGIDLNYGRIRHSALPTHAHDVATKQYVDSLKLANWNHIERFDGDGANTVFEVSVPISTYNAIVSVGGVIQEPFDSYEFEFYKGLTRLKFFEAPPLETKVSIRTTTSTNVSSSTALEEIFIATDKQSSFSLANEVYDKFGLMVTIDGVVQSTLNYDILTTPAGKRTVTDSYGNNTEVFYGNEYKILKFAEGLDLGATVRVLNVRGRGFHSHSGTTVVLENDTLVPNTTNASVYTYATLANSNNTFNINHDLIANRGGLNVYANTVVDNLYINLPEMGSEYSPDNHLEVKVAKGTQTANVFINAHAANFMNYEGVFDGNSGEGVAYNRQPNVPSVIHLEWESFYRTWYIKYGVGIWNVNANTITYPNSAP